LQVVGAGLRLGLAHEEDGLIRLHFGQAGEAGGEIFYGGHVVVEQDRGVGGDIGGGVDDALYVVLGLGLFEHAAYEAVGWFLAILLSFSAKSCRSNPSRYKSVDALVKYSLLKANLTMP
jgi:hypothetical protein